MKLLVSILLILLSYFPIKGNILTEKIQFKEDCQERVDSLLQLLNTSDDPYIMVVAHRGDWTNAPENSLPAILNAINIGVDIVEIDVRMTKDNVPVLMHDRTIDRTTTGNGKLSEWTLDSLRTLYLKNSSGIPTHHKIPTLEEALLISRGKILVNLDKCSRRIKQIAEILNKTGTHNQAIFKRKKDFYRIRLHQKCKKHKLIYIPRIKKRTHRIERQVNEFATKHKPLAFDIRFTPGDSITPPLIHTIKKNACRVWVNTIESEQCNKNNSSKNYISPYETWAWAIEWGANIILTDNPAPLIDYLKQKGLREKK